MRDYILKLPTFEGPLDLLIHFVHTNDVDIRHLPIAPICRKYLEFLRACEEIDLTLSSEWLAMAARLIYIKSCTLLPGKMLDEAPGSESWWDDVEDPKAALIRELLDRERLLAIRNALPAMRLLEEKSLDSYTRKGLGDFEFDEAKSYDLGEIGIYDLLDLYRQTLVRRHKHRPIEMEVRHLRLSDVVREILSRFLPKGVKQYFISLLPPDFDMHRCVMTFLAILELARTGRVQLYQIDPASDLQVERIR